MSSQRLLATTDPRFLRWCLVVPVSVVHISHMAAEQSTAHGLLMSLRALQATYYGGE
jgi:hypothetical protein